jgi:hypothetical protein
MDRMVIELSCPVLSSVQMQMQSRILAMVRWSARPNSLPAGARVMHISRSSKGVSRRVVGQRVDDSSTPSHRAVPGRHHRRYM